VSEFGAQAVPDSAEFCAPHRWPNLDWDELEAHHCLQRRLLESRVPSGEHATFDSWRVATQQYQADLLQLQIEDLRRIKYQPTGGYCLFSFADPHPAISWSILGHDRAPKAAYRAVAAASRPLLALVDHRTGDVHVVNDTDASFPDAVVEVAVGDVLSVFGGVVEADSLTWVGRVDLAADRPVITRLHVAGQPPIEHRPAGDPGVRRDAWATSEGRIRLAETARK
jgi:beta-mannosidase